MGGVVSKTKPLHKDLEAYFSSVVGTFRDRLPMEKMIFSNVETL